MHKLSSRKFFLSLFSIVCILLIQLAAMIITTSAVEASLTSVAGSIAMITLAYLGANTGSDFIRRAKGDSDEQKNI